MFQLDEGDDWKDENVWIKANPALGTTVTYRALREQVDTAINIPGEEVSIRTKNMNQWVQSQNVWLPYDMLMDVSEEVNLDDYAFLFQMTFLQCRSVFHQMKTVK